jgi:hypothetical protein
VSRFEDLVEQLSAVPPRDFAKERAELAARLAKLGQPAEAARVKSLRAPAVPVWAANRLVREHPELAQRLVSAAERVRAAQLGRDTTIQLASAMGGYRAAVDALVQRLDVLLGVTGVKASPPVRLRIRNTLMAAAADPKFRSALLHGDLTQELTAPGFDLFQGAAAAERPGGRARSAEAPQRREKRPDAPPRPSAQERQAAAREERARRLIEARAAAEREREAHAERLRPLREAAATAAEELARARDEARRAVAAVAVAARRKREADAALRNARNRR